MREEGWQKQERGVGVVAHIALVLQEVVTVFLMLLCS
jgi:hypothetical protein